MPFLSELTGHTVADINGERIGRLDDLVAVVPQDLSHPKIVALVVKRAGGPLLIPLADVVVLFAPAVALNKRLEDIAPYQPSEPTSIWCETCWINRSSIPMVCGWCALMIWS